ncbi:MAG TPA: transposase, partial [Bryobacteraceae bacterium]|nr:transposase [Bryobacteraceae bacterium]
MQRSENQPIRQYWQLCQRHLFPVLEEQLGPLSENYRLLAAALALLGDAGIAAPARKRRGRRSHDRLPIFRALLAKSFLNLVSTRQLLEQLRHNAALRQLCGWNSSQQVPSESVFSRVFSGWSGSDWVEQLQAGVIAEVYRDRLVGHVIRDATAVPARERCRRKAAPPVQRRPRGRPRKGSPPAAKKRLDRQPGMQLAEMLDDLPKHGDWGVRFDERGRKQRWKGYKLHCDLSDSGLPLSYVLTS